MELTSPKQRFGARISGDGDSAILFGAQAKFSPTGSDFLDLIRLPDGLEPAARFIAARGIPFAADACPATDFHALKESLSEVWADYRQNELTRRLIDRLNPVISELRYQLVFEGDVVVGVMAGEPSHILWHQMVHAIVNQLHFNDCLECGLVFKPSRKGQGESQPYCSTNCRSRAGQRRAFMADDPAAAGAAFLETMNARFEKGGFPLAYSGMGPGVPIKDWAGGLWDMIIRRIDTDRIMQHLQISRGCMDTMVTLLASGRDLELVIEKHPI